MPAKKIVRAAPTAARDYMVKVFEVAPRHLRHRPIAMKPLIVSARSGDEARRKAREDLRTAGRVVRSLSSSQTPDALVAYVEPLPTAPGALRSPPQR